MSAIIFVGPSLLSSIESSPRIEVRPPAVAGDIYRAVRSGAELIGLIDARFEDGQTVLHDEILYALSKGAHVWGAASMGALRAVECAPFGMLGFGEIFEMYRAGRIDGDHEVAMQYGPDELGSPALTIPLVNVRATLDSSVENGILNASEAGTVLSTALGLYYKNLTWESVLEELASAAIGSKLQNWLPEGYVDLKNQDARVLIDSIESFMADSVVPHIPTFEFQETVFWKSFVVTQERSFSSLSGQDADVIDELRLDPLRYSDAVQRAFARRMARNGYPENFQGGVSTADEIRVDFGLMTASSFADWLAENRTDEALIAQFLDKDAHLEKTQEAVAASLALDILDELRAENEFGPLDRRAADKRARLAGRDLANVPSSYAGFDLRDLLEWFCENRGVKGSFADPDEAARSLGLPDRNALHLLLRRELEYSRVVE